MVRELKEPEARKADIIDAAEKLFFTKGYGATTTGDILEKVGIARGTLYYYYKSKEEIMDAVIDREISRQLGALMPIVDDKSLNAIEKLKLLFFHTQTKEQDQEMLEHLHQPENSIMHQKSLAASVQRFAPVLAKIFEQGIRENLFQTDHPLELAEFILVGMNFLFDTSIFSWKPDEIAIRMETLAGIMETSLRAKKGSFSFVFSAD